MAKLSGSHIIIYLDDSGGTPRDISTNVESIDIPDEYGELDVTGFSDGVVNSIAGMPTMPVEITGNMDAASNSLFDIAKAAAGGGARTLTVQVGQNTAVANGDPEFDGEFWCSKMSISASPTGKPTLTVSLRPSGSTAPAWGTVSGL